MMTVTSLQKNSYFYPVRSKLSILFYLKHGSPAKDGKLPLMCRLTINGESTSFSCKRRIDPDKWDPNNGEMIGDDDESQTINMHLKQMREQLLSDFAAILQEYGSIRPQWLKDYTLGTSDRQEMLLYMYNKFNEDFRKSVGHGRSKSSYERYAIVYRHLKTFIRQRYNLDDVRIKYVTFAMINAFEYYLRVGLGLRNNTVWVYMITFKHIISLARATGAIRSDPFATYKNRFEQVERGYLTEDELQRLLLYPVDNSTQRLVRDMFAFSAFTGLSYSDVKALRWENIRTLFEGQTWIVTRRRKTNTPSNLLLLDIPKRILEQYGNKDTPTIFKIPSNNCCNEYLVDLGRRCGIATRVTFHVARHTFATLSLSKGMPIETLSSVLGHTNIRTTQIYAKITNQKIKEDMAMLSDRIKSIQGPE